MEKNEIRKLFNVRDFSERTGLTVSHLRALIFHRHQNGFFTVVRKVGRKVLLDMPSFDRWIAEINDLPTAEVAEHE